MVTKVLFKKEVQRGWNVGAFGAMVRHLALVSVMGFSWGGQIYSQQMAAFTIEVSTDSILLGNYFEVTFTLQNANGNNFEPPIFKDFQVMAGPNVSTSLSMTNGQVKQSVTYSYYLEPKDIGNYYIEPASIEADGQVLVSEPLEIMVVPNPEGIIQQPINRRGTFKFDMGSPFGQDFFNNEDFFNGDPFQRIEELRKQLFQGLPPLGFELPAPDTLPQAKPKRKVYRM
ncbi:MAG: protein BatD [Saprospiraceae bacterium]|nr:protein BatD [Saprospiraceae bacterium]